MSTRCGGTFGFDGPLSILSNTNTHRVRVEREEREFWQKLREETKTLEMEKEQRLLLAETDSV